MHRWLSGALIAFALCLGGQREAGAQSKTAAAEAYAQARLRSGDSSTTFIVRLKDGSSFAGRVLLMRNDSVSFNSSVGPFMLAIRDVRSVTVVRSRDIRNGQYWFPSPNSTQLLVAPTGRTLAKGDGYYSDIQLFFPAFATGLTDRITIGGGISILPYIDLEDQMMWATPKVALIRRDDLNVAVGALAISSSGISPFYEGADEDRDHFGMLYSVATFGGPHASVTTGLGVPYVERRISGGPVFLLGGEARASEHTAMVTETYLSSGGTLTALGMRFFSETISADFGIYTNAGANGFLFPFVAFVASF